MQRGESYKVRFDGEWGKLGTSRRFAFQIADPDMQRELVSVEVANWLMTTKRRGKDARAVAARAVRYYLENPEKIPEQHLCPKEEGYVVLKVTTYWYPGCPGCAEVEESWKEFEVAKLAKPRPRMGFIKDNNT